jgi:hypothetical protein
MAITLKPAPVTPAMARAGVAVLEGGAGLDPGILVARIYRAMVAADERVPVLNFKMIDDPTGLPGVRVISRKEAARKKKR